MEKYEGENGKTPQAFLHWAARLGGRCASSLPGRCSLMGSSHLSSGIKWIITLGADGAAPSTPARRRV